MKIDWDNVWGCIFTTAAILALALLFTAVVSDHKVRGYYLTDSTHGATIAADYAWQPDSTVYWDADINKVIQVLQALNTTVQK